MRDRFLPLKSPSCFRPQDGQRPLNLPFKAGALQVVLVITSLALLAVGAARAGTKLGWSLGPDVPAHQLDNVDGDPSFIHDHGLLWLVYSDGSCRWHTLSGKNVDSLTEQSVFDTHAAFPRPYGDDRYWVIGAWADPKTGLWYATVHVEFRYGAWGHGNAFNHYRRIALAVSPDRGHTWHLQGDILTPPLPTQDDAHAYPGRAFSTGDGDQKLFVDTAHGFFYVFSMSAWVDKVTGERTHQQIHAARAPIAGRMAASTWVKWYDGRWGQPGLGGHETAIASADSFTVFWDGCAGRYLAIVNDGEGRIYSCPDLTSERWTDQGRLSASGGPNGVLWYNWPVDAADLAGRWSVGCSFRLYSADNDYRGVGTKYMLVTLRR